MRNQTGMYIMSPTSTQYEVLVGWKFGFNTVKQYNRCVVVYMFEFIDMCISNMFYSIAYIYNVTNNSFTFSNIRCWSAFKKYRDY